MQISSGLTSRLGEVVKVGMTGDVEAPGASWRLPLAADLEANHHVHHRRQGWNSASVSTSCLGGCDSFHVFDSFTVFGWHRSKDSGFYSKRSTLLTRYFIIIYEMYISLERQSTLTPPDLYELSSATDGYHVHTRMPPLSRVRDHRNVIRPRSSDGVAKYRLDEFTSSSC